MIELAEVLPPTLSPLWKLAKQAGVDWVVGGLPFNDPQNGADAPWDYMPLLRMQQRYESGGFKLAVIESRPPLNNAKRGFVDKTPYDTTSILKLITKRFGLEPLPGVREKMGDLTNALELAQ